MRDLKTRGLILGISLMGLGAIGWVMGFVFSGDYYLSTGHIVLHYLGHLALGIGPSVIILGAVLFFAFFVEGYYHKPVPPADLRPGIYPVAEQPPNKKCPNCGTQNPVDAVFCLKCGQQFSELMDDKNLKEGF